CLLSGSCRADISVSAECQAAAHSALPRGSRLCELSACAAAGTGALWELRTGAGCRARTHSSRLVSFLSLCREGFVFPATEQLDEAVPTRADTVQSLWIWSRTRQRSCAGSSPLSRSIRTTQSILNRSSTYPANQRAFGFA